YIPPSCSPLFTFLLFSISPSPRSTLFPYTTLFRSAVGWIDSVRPAACDQRDSRPRHQSLRLHAPGDGHAVPLCRRQERGVEATRSEEHTSELQSLAYLVCRLLLEKKNTNTAI